MPVTRANLQIGPALCVFGTAKWYTKDNVDIRIETSTFDIGTDAHGFIETRADSHLVTVSMTPEGRWNATLVPELWPYASTIIGSSIFTAADVPLTINGVDGRLHTIHSAAITRMPDIYLGATRTITGAMEFTGVRKTGIAWSTDLSLYTIAETGGTAVFNGDTGFNSSDILTQSYTGVWGAQGGFTAIETVDGWTISFEMTTADIAVDDSGLIDKRLTGVKVMARCTPIKPTATQIQSAHLYQGTGAARGRQPGALYDGTAASLVITGSSGAPVVTIPRAAFVSSGYRFGSTVLGYGEIGFVGGRNVASGVQSAAWTLV